MECVNERKYVRSRYLTISTYIPTVSNASCDTEGFHDLPETILVEIFKYFSETELRKNIIPVCRKWRQAAFAPILWRGLAFKGAKVPVDFIFQQIRVLPYLERISMINIVNVEVAIRQMCRCNKELKMITIKNCKYTDDIEGKFPEPVLRNVVLNCKKLEKLNLKGTPFDGRYFYMDAAALPNLKYIQFFQIKTLCNIEVKLHIAYLSPTSLMLQWDLILRGALDLSINLGNNPFLQTKNLYELILNCHRLEELKLSYRSTEQYLVDTDMLCLFAKLKPTLKSITFDMAGLSDTSLAVRIITEFRNLTWRGLTLGLIATDSTLNIFSQAILECNKLEKLNLYNTSNLSSELFEGLWKKLPNLKILKIQNSVISNEHFVRLFTDGRSILCNLKLLNLSGAWKLNSTTLEIISECCPNLEKVVLKCCKNLETLDNFLENCPNITSLNVAFCEKISDENLMKIPGKLLKLNTFYLDVHRRKLLENMKNIYPQLNIIICLSEFSKNMEKLH